MIVKKYSEGNKEKYNWSLLYTLGLDQQLCSSFVFGEMVLRHFVNQVSPFWQSDESF